MGECIKAANGMTARLRASHARDELEELRELVKRQEAAIQEMKRRENLGRGAASDAKPISGRTRVVDTA